MYTFSTKIEIYYYILHTRRLLSWLILTRKKNKGTVAVVGTISGVARDNDSPIFVTRGVKYCNGVEIF